MSNPAAPVAQSIKGLENGKIKVASLAFAENQDRNVAVRLCAEAARILQQLIDTDEHGLISPARVHYRPGRHDLMIEFKPYCGNKAALNALFATVGKHVGFIILDGGEHSL